MSREYVIARYEKGGRKFEILVNPGKAFKFLWGTTSIRTLGKGTEHPQRK